MISFLALLALAGFVKHYFSLADRASASARDTVVAAVQSGLKIYASKGISEGVNESYPSVLDSAPDGADASKVTPLFGDVLEAGVERHWHKWTAACYSFTGPSESGGASNDYFRYDHSLGTFAPSLPSSCMQ